MASQDEQFKIDLVLHCLTHVYLEAEHEALETLPPVMVFRSLKLFAEKFRSSPLCGEVLGWTPEELAEKLVSSGYAKQVSFRREGNRVVFEVKGCRYAPYVHPYISREYMCPYVSMAILVLRERHGKASLAGKLPEKTEDGIRAEFEIHD